VGMIVVATMIVLVNVGGRRGSHGWLGGDDRLAAARRQRKEDCGCGSQKAGRGQAGHDALGEGRAGPTNRRDKRPV